MGKEPDKVIAYRVKFKHQLCNPDKPREVDFTDVDWCEKSFGKIINDCKLQRLREFFE